MRVVFFCLVLSISFSGFAQKGYNIDFQIHNLSDTTIYLGNFFGESTYLKDTAHVDQAGKFNFSGSEPLERGVYFLVLNKTKLFEILINNDQTFRIETSHPDYIKDAKVTGDVDNRIFFANMLYNTDRNLEAGPYVRILRDSTTSAKAKEEARIFLEKINDKVMEHQDGIIEQQPETLLSKILKANKPIDVPENPVLANGKIDSTFKYKYYKAHYWDNFDLSDPAMIRLSNPLYRKKVDDYLDKLLVQHPDTLIKAIDHLANIAKKNPDTYKYIIWTTTVKYQQPEIMGLDEVFVHNYDKYFATGEMDYWANDQMKKNLEERANQLRNSLIGMQAPELTMLDENLQAKSLYDLKNKYTLIYFYDPDCSHCKKETPKLKEFYDNTTFDVGIYAVSADTSMAKMKDYIKTMHLNDWITVDGPRTYTGPYHKLYDANSTPTIYVLDEKKKIIAKKLPAEQLDDFLRKYEELDMEVNKKVK